MVRQSHGQSSSSSIGDARGDEGKGKIVDLLTERAVRRGALSRSGHNAGHTLVIGGNENRPLAHSLRDPAQRRCAASSATAWCFPSRRLLTEAQTRIGREGVPVFERLRISPSCPLILPSHVALDRAREQARGVNAIGTTGRGIGPAYEDKVARRAVRVADLFQARPLRRRDCARCSTFHNFLLEHSLPPAPGRLSEDARHAAHPRRKDRRRSFPDVTLELRERCACRRCERDRSRARRAPCSMWISAPIRSSTSSEHHGRLRQFRDGHWAARLRRCAGDRQGLCHARRWRAVSRPSSSMRYGEHFSKKGHEFGSVTGRASPLRLVRFGCAAARAIIHSDGIEPVHHEARCARRPRRRCASASATALDGKVDARSRRCRCGRLVSQD